MLHVINHKTYSERPYNEDSYGFSNNFIFVLDGATGLKENNIMGYGDDAAWFVNNIKDYLQTNLNQNKEITVLLKEITNILFNEYKHKTKDLDMVSMPSSCISLFRIKDNVLEFYGLGDCVGLVELNDGSIDFFIDQNLENLDQIAIDKMVEISKEKNISPIKARPYIQDILAKHRTYRNSEKGYYSLDLTGIGINHAVYKQYNIQNVKRIACLSDGLYEVMAFSMYKDFTSLLNALEYDIEDVFKKLQTAQENDREGIIVPRFKKSDDTTGIIAKIQ